MLSYNDPDTKEPIPVDPRGTLKKTMEKAEALGYTPYAGVEYEVYTPLTLR
jgi:glutamine synthetase